MKPLYFSIITLLLMNSLHCSDDLEGKKNETMDSCQTDLNISLGNDTTIIFGDTLTLDAGSCFSSFSWNSGLSNEQFLDVIDSGAYWVTVIDSFGKYSSDTINISLLDTIRTCNSLVDVQVFDFFWLKIPCYYYYTESGGEDVIYFRTGTRDEMINIQGSFLFGVFKPDTLQHLPIEQFDGYDSFQETIFNENGQKKGYFLYAKVPTILTIRGVYVHQIEDEFIVPFSLSFNERFKNEAMKVMSSIRF